MARTTLLAAAAALLAAPAAADISACFASVSTSPARRARFGAAAAPVDCSAAGGREGDACLLLCGFCSTPELVLGFDPAVEAAVCSGAAPPGNATDTGALVASAFYNATALMGHWFLDGGGSEDNATLALTHLFSYMPRNDALALFADPRGYAEFLVEHVRGALLAYQRTKPLGVPWDVFLDGVLPYAVLNEKRDHLWRWRPRFAQLFASAWVNASTISQAMHNLTALIPVAAPDALLALNVGAGGPLAPVPGRAITWKSETSPAYISPEQVARYSGSCTGTGIMLVAAARAIGIPARLEGCSQSIPGDDHHWATFYDPSAASPLGDFWHTKEGVSAGNAGGPWDAPSGPMLGCLAYAQPGSQLNTLWASVWSAPAYLPTQWTDYPLAQEWAFVGGVNRCGAYCSAWGCGVNNTQHWTQAQCWPQQQ